MKNILFILLGFLPLISLSQIQIGADIDGEAEGDQSGKSVSLSADGNVVAIGATGNDDNGQNAGHVRVYQNNEGTWTQVGEDIDGEGWNDTSGFSVSLSSEGSVLAIGAYGNDGNGPGAGHVRVFKNNAGNWTQIGEDIDGEAPGDGCGASVSLSSDGTVVAIGAFYNDGNGQNAGHVRIFHNSQDTWTQVGEDIDGGASGDRSGQSVSLTSDGNVVAIGSHANSDNGEYAGQVRVFENIAGAWIQVGADINGEGAGDWSGRSVSLSADGTVVAIGAHENNGNGNNTGHVRVFENLAGNWTQVGADIFGEAALDSFGFSVSLSANGNILAIGAPTNDENGSGAGHVRLFQNISGTWMQVGTDINGEAAGDLSGYSVSISADGTVVAIGARKNEGNGIDAGHVRVYDLSAILSGDHFVRTNFMVYPNPASDFLTIQLNQGLELESVNIYSSTGQLVKSERKAVISVNDLAKGTYLLELVTDRGRAAQTIIVTE